MFAGIGIPFAFSALLITDHFVYELSTAAAVAAAARHAEWHISAPRVTLRGRGGFESAIDFDTMWLNVAISIARSNPQRPFNAMS